MSFRTYVSLEIGQVHSPFPSIGKGIGLPSLVTQPVCLVGTPIFLENFFKEEVTTAPAPTKAYSSIVTPQTMVEFAPKVAPFFIKVFIGVS